MQKISAMFGVVLGVGILTTYANDMPSGGDGIPFLTNQASLIVKVAKAEMIAAGSGSAATLYSAKVAEVLKGTARPGDVLNVEVIPEGTSSPKAEYLEESIVFLSGPISKEQAKRRGIVREGDVYLVMSGTRGIIPVNEPGRWEALRDYITADKKGRLEWAQKYSKSKDTFLQRSALLEVAQRPANDPQVLELLGDAIRSQEVTSRNKDLAVRSLQHSNSEEALKHLRDFAQDKNTPKALRATAVEALVSLPGGRQELQRIRNDGDEVLAPVASQALAKSEPRENDVAVSPSRLEAIGKGLKSPTASNRRRAAEQAKQFTYSSDLAELLKGALTSPKEAVPVKQAAIEALTGFNNRASATILESIATDDQQPMEVRTAAIMGIARMDTGVGVSVLRRLKTSLRDAQLSELAGGLAEGR